MTGRPSVRTRAVSRGWRCPVLTSRPPPISFCSTSLLAKVVFKYGSVFPDSSIGKESACNAGDPGLISGSGRSAGEGIGYPLQYSGASLVAQLVKNLPAMQETWV